MTFDPEHLYEPQSLQSEECVTKPAVNQLLINRDKIQVKICIYMDI
jgi:hypothetical protein